MKLPKLIASDIDGTLLLNGATELPEALFPLIRRLRERGVLFCPASGRQYHSLRALFAPVADELCFLCENGAVILGPGTEKDAPLLYKSVIGRDTSMELIREIMELPESTPLVSVQNTTYVCSDQKTLFWEMEHLIGNNMASFDRPEEIREDIVKIAAYCPGTLAAVERKLKPRWEHRLNVAVAGKTWLDFTPANKGTGIGNLCAALHISPEEVIAIGDNWNDVPMLDAVGQPWMMSGAAQELRARYPRQCDSVPALLTELLCSAE